MHLTRAEAQNVIHAFVEVVNRSTSPTPTSAPSSSSHSTTSADSTRVEEKSTRDEDVVSNGEGPVDEGSVPALVSVLFTTRSYHGNRLATGSAGSTATSTTAVSPTASAPIIASVPSVASGAPVLPATPGVTNAAVAPLVAATVAPTAPPVAVPLYAALPPNAPSNAILPPTHLMMAPRGYHIPAANADGPFYVVTRGRNLGIFSGWSVFFRHPALQLLTRITQGDRLSFGNWGQSCCLLACSQCGRRTRQDECGQHRIVFFILVLILCRRCCT